MVQAILAAAISTVTAFAASKVVAVNVDGMVHPITAEIVGGAIAQAQKTGASAVLIRLNTPGGLLEATRDVDGRIVSSAVPVITYVTPSGGRAASAGFFILESGDVAAMAPGTNTGAASPVLFGQTMDPVMRSKIENDTAAMLRGIVTKRGRNAELAEKTVREAKSFTDKEALDSKLIEVVAPNERQLLDDLDGREITRFDGRKQTLATRGAEIVDYKLTIRQRVVSAVADPNIGFILLAIGALGIYLEFTTPGVVLPGVAGAILALLGLSALSIFPISLTGVALLVLSVVLFVLEAKFASHGVLGISGVVSMVLGAMLLIDAPPEFRIHFETAAAVALPFGLITIFLLSLVLRSRRAKVVTGAQGLLDSVGEARTRLDPSGKVFVHGEYWDAVSSMPVDPGAAVRVVEIKGLTLKVEPCSISR